MRIEMLPVEYQTFYIAEDGTEWKTEKQCEQYESLLADPSPLKELRFFSCRGERIDIFALGCIPDYCYIHIPNEGIPDFDGEVIRIILGGKEKSDRYNLPYRAGVWYNDFPSRNSSGWGIMCWKKIDSLFTLKENIRVCQEKIELLEKIYGTP